MIASGRYFTPIKADRVCNDIGHKHLHTLCNCIYSNCYIMLNILVLTLFTERNVNFNMVVLKKLL